MNNLKKLIIYLVVILAFIATILIIGAAGLSAYNIWTEELNLALHYKLLLISGLVVLIAYVLYKVYDLFF